MTRRSRIISAFAAFALLATAAGTALAAAPPTIEVICPQVQDIDQGSTDYFWYVSLPGDASNYDMEWSTNGTDWNGPIDWSDQNDPLIGGGFGGPLGTTSFSEDGGDHLYVRWSSDPDSKVGPVFNDCAPEATPTPTPLVTPTPVETPVVTPAASTLPDAAMAQQSVAGIAVFGLLFIGLGLLLLADYRLARRRASR